MTTPPPAGPPPDPIVNPQQVKAAPFYWPNLIAALISAIAVAVGSIGPWISFMGMSRSNVGEGADGTITLVLGITAALALFALLNFGRTQVRSKRMVALGVVAAVAGLLAFLIGFIDARDVVSRKAEIFGKMVGPDIGWGLWMILIAGPALAITSAIVVKQVMNIANFNSAPGTPRYRIQLRKNQPKASPPPAPPAASLWTQSSIREAAPPPPPPPAQPATKPAPSSPPPVAAPQAPAPPAPPAAPASPAAVDPPAQPEEIPAVPAPLAAPYGPPKRLTAADPPPAPTPTPMPATAPSGAAGRSGLRRAAPWAGGVAALAATFAAGVLTGPYLIGDRQPSGSAVAASTTTKTVTTTAQAAPPATPSPSPAVPDGSPAGTFGPFDSGDAKVFVDGKPREVRGTVNCFESSDSFFLAMDPPGNKVIVTLSPDQSRVLSVNLGRVNGESIPAFLDGAARGDASVTKDGKLYRVTGTVATGFSATSPTVPFDIEVTCP